MPDAPKQHKWWFKGRVSPGFQRFVSCTTYGLGYAKAAVEKRHKDWRESRTFENQHEQKSSMKTVLVWFNAFTKGAEKRRRELRAEAKKNPPITAQGA